jgi:hypothetical protein
MRLSKCVWTFESSSHFISYIRRLKSILTVSALVSCFEHMASHTSLAVGRFRISMRRLSGTMVNTWVMIVASR